MRPTRLRLRLRLRTLLIAVAVAGLALGGWKRREYCLARARKLEDSARVEGVHAELCDLEAAEFRDVASALSPVAIGPGHSAREAAESAARTALEAARHRADAVMFGRLARAYRRVARYPWLPLPREPE